MVSATPGSTSSVWKIRSLKASSAATDAYSEASWGTSEVATENDRSNRALYAEYAGSPVGGVQIVLGGRLDDNETFGRFETVRLGLSRSRSSWRSDSVSARTAYFVAE